MLGFLLAVLVGAIGIAAFPCWRHSAQWGYAPASVAGALLILVAALTIGEHVTAASSQPVPARVAGQRP